MSRKGQSAAKYAELSKSKKKKTPNRSYIQAATFTDGEFESAEVVSSKRSIETVNPALARRRKVSQIIDYHYVVSDLKRIAFVGGAMLLLLIVLSLLIR